ncbi:wlm [Cordyceps fumosorosea ARSEF 2679]|uniref:Wlm n=1 Tax=Cordyceps fumosorosea (strain ARSEF 2679) TaxID=1081104 RepID=A0A168DZ18_CORFA|nr:wlm [Cordyceps fumosorosea ARSEF 2679]OAA73170.1 wlm [Cordyceps fumosorosea ARSEF 2679]
MKEHHISVVTLEEHEPNREFVGRNFNAGEVVQLVLRSARAPRRWLPFRYVQMVMMHELAHCAQMNHSRAFWAVRDAYAAQMTALWARGYTGEGIWGRGVALDAAAWERDAVKVEEEPLPEHLCGGTYRSRRRRKRGAGPELSWRERRDRRIAKRFGTAGTALGADEQQKTRLEGGRRVVARPRVAGSARGRELRAAAALARFDKQKVEEESGSDYEEEEEDVTEAVDWDGKRITDGDGRAMVKVCGDEEEGEEDQGAARRSERDELRRVLLTTHPHPPPPPPTTTTTTTTTTVKAERDDAGRPRPRIKDEPSDEANSATVSSGLRDATPPRPLRLHDIPHIRDAVPPRQTRTAPPSRRAPPATAARRPAITIHRLPTTKTEREAVTTTMTTSPSDGRCPLCSLDNVGGKEALRCAACAHVLRPDAVRGAWSCESASCAGTGYVNAGDCGICGLCGGRRP